MKTQQKQIIENKTPVSPNVSDETGDVKFNLGMLAADCACSVKWEIEKAGKKLRPEYWTKIAFVIRESLYASNI